MSIKEQLFKNRQDKIKQEKEAREYRKKWKILRQKTREKVYLGCCAVIEECVDLEVKLPYHDIKGNEIKGIVHGKKISQDYVFELDVKETIIARLTVNVNINNRIIMKLFAYDSQTAVSTFKVLSSVCWKVEEMTGEKECDYPELYEHLHKGLIDYFNNIFCFNEESEDQDEDEEIAKTAPSEFELIDLDLED